MLTPPPFLGEKLLSPFPRGTSYKAAAPSSLAGQFRHSTTAAWQHKNNDWTHLGHLFNLAQLFSDPKSVQDNCHPRGHQFGQLNLALTEEGK